MVVVVVAAQALVVVVDTALVAIRLPRHRPFYDQLHRRGRGGPHERHRRRRRRRRRGLRPIPTYVRCTRGRLRLACG